MPVILPDDVYDLWLDPGLQTAEAFCEMLKPFDPALMERCEVTSRVNLVRTMIRCRGGGDAGTAAGME